MSSKSTWKKIDVEYSDEAVLLIEEKDACIDRILGVKSPHWKYEEEVRFIKESEKRINLRIKIHRIYLGMNLSKTEVEFYKILIDKFFHDKVEVLQIKRNDIDFGYKE